MAQNVDIYSFVPEHEFLVLNPVFIYKFLDKLSDVSGMLTIQRLYFSLTLILLARVISGEWDNILVFTIGPNFIQKINY